jgi:hypothetical protein
MHCFLNVGLRYLREPTFMSRSNKPLRVVITTPVSAADPNLPNETDRILYRAFVSECMEIGIGMGIVVDAYNESGDRVLSVYTTVATTLGPFSED